MNTGKKFKMIMLLLPFWLTTNTVLASSTNSDILTLFIPGIVAQQKVSFFLNPNDHRIVELNDSDSANKKVTYYGTKDTLGNIQSLDSISTSGHLSGGDTFNTFFEFGKIDGGTNSKVTDIFTSPGINAHFIYGDGGRIKAIEYRAGGNSYIIPIKYDANSIPSCDTNNINVTKTSATPNKNTPPSTGLSGNDTTQSDMLNITVNAKQCEKPVNSYARVILYDKNYSRIFPEVTEITPFTITIPRNAAPAENSKKWESKCKSFVNSDAFIQSCMFIDELDTVGAESVAMSCSAFTAYAAATASPLVIPGGFCIALAKSIPAAKLFCASSEKLCDLSANGVDWYYDNTVRVHVNFKHPTTGKVESEEIETYSSQKSASVNHNFIADVGSVSATLFPDTPYAQQKYKISGHFNCVSAGSSMKISVHGSDGYSDSSTTIASSTNGDCIHNARGGASGVEDKIEFFVNNKLIETKYVKFSEDLDITGDWNLSYDWHCDGSSNSAGIHFNTNHTAIVNDHSSTPDCIWARSGDTIKFNFSNLTTYTGTLINGMNISGTMKEGPGLGDDTGCWSATRIENDISTDFSHSSSQNNEAHSSGEYVHENRQQD